MKLHFFIPDLTSGGAERVFSTLLRLWSPEDEVTLVVLRREGVYLDLLPADLRIVSLDTSRMLTALPRLFGFWRRERPDAVLATQAHVNGLLGLLARWLPKTRFVGRETSLPSRARVQKKLPRWQETLYKIGYRRLAAVICPSRVIADELSRDYGVPSARLPVVPNPVDLEALEVLAREELTGRLKTFMDEPGSFVVAASGRLEAVKGFDLLLEAAALLPPRFRFVIMGEGRERPALETMVEKLALTGRVLLTGFETNPHRVTARAKAFVLSSRYEGFPNAVLEALALGTPVAAFRAPGGISDILENGVTGVFAEPENPSALAEALIKVASRTWPGEELRARIRERYDGLSVAARYRHIIKETLNG